MGSPIATCNDLDLDLDRDRDDLDGWMNGLQSVTHNTVLRHPSRATRPLDRVMIFVAVYNGGVSYTIAASMAKEGRTIAR